MGTEKPPVLHILVVGFHHKLGCQVEFSYPPLISGTSGKNECPSGWKYMPTLALPDGSHNFTEDTVFFNLPSLIEPTESVYGISCYRQIPVEKLKNRTADVTRSTVQKSVCVLTRLPIYGYIEVKLSLIADAFFEQCDFTNTELLIKAYNQLNACLLDDESRRSQRHFHVGLSLREIVLHWRHKTLILFKLFLLQRRVICFGSPVRSMCSLILGISSLIPRLLEKGWQEVACVRTSRPLSPMPDFTDTIQRDSDEFSTNLSTNLNDNYESEDLNVDCIGNESPTLVSRISGSGDSSPKSSSQSTRELNRIDSSEGSDVCSPSGTIGIGIKRESSVETYISNLSSFAVINPDEYRSPIPIFASGNLCLPYLSLPYMDLLGDPSVLSYIIGTSNFLFQQKRQLSDILIDIENANMDCHDPELKRQLVLSTEDLRFMDFIMKNVQNPKEEGEGSEIWIREQFQGYILALLRSSLNSDNNSKEIDHFNVNFMNAFRRTQCFQEWFDVKPDDDFFDALPTDHPFAGNLSVADMKMKIAQTMQNTEGGRRINQAVHTTSKAVGGALTQAKGALSNWWSSITTAPALASVVSSTSTTKIQEGSIEINESEEEEEEIPEFTVSFQNRENLNEEGMTVCIHLDVTKDGSNVDRMSLMCNEKLVDSAEELGEDIEKKANKRNTVSDVKQSECSNALSQGIVEIGHEAAEMLDKKEANSTITGIVNQLQTTEISLNLNSSHPSTCSATTTAEPDISTMATGTIVNSNESNVEDSNVDKNVFIV